MADIEIEGLNELLRTLGQLERMPQKCVNKAVNRGAAVVHKQIKRNAPVDTGELKRGIIRKPEKRRKLGKRIVQIVFSAHMNDVFVKTSKEGKRAYYPASIEYGFRTKGGGYVPGEYFMRSSADEVKQVAMKKMVDVLAEEIDKLR